MKRSKCAVPGCTSENPANYHRIPTTAWRVELWKQAIKSPVLENLKNEELCKYFVCSDHFEASDYSANSSRHQLCKHAKPSRNLPGQSSASEMECENLIQEVTVELNGDKLKENDLSCESSSTTNSSVPFTQLINPEDEVQPVQEILEEEEAPGVKVKGKTILKSRGGQIRVPLEVRGYIAKLKERNASLQRTNTSLRKKNKSLGQRLQRASTQVQKTKQVMKSDRIINWEKLTPIQETFIQMQLANVGKHPKGRRFTTKQKIIGLAMLKRSAQFYNFLANNFIVPGATTINEVLEKIPCSTGLTEIVFEKLKEFGEKMEEKEKFCTLIWDEVSLMLHLQYSKSSDQLVGFEDWGYRRTAGFADHAIVFFIRGINSGWALPLFYGFCSHLTKEADLVRCIRLVAQAVENAGFHILTTVCDQASTNRSAIHKLIEKSNIERQKRGECKKDTIVIGHSEIIPIMDPPHIIKSTRNNLITKPFQINFQKQTVPIPTSKSKTKRPLQTATTDKKPQLARWAVIEKAYKIDQMSHGFHPLMRKLTDQHIYESKLHKMRVKHAVQVLSNSVAKCIECFAETGFVGLCPSLGAIDEEEGKNTAYVCKFFNDVFDSVNGSLPSNPNTTPPLRMPVTENSPHHVFWQEAISKLQMMRYVDPVSLTTPKQKAYPIPSWLMTLKGFQSLWQVLKSKGVNELQPKYINQDILENYFGRMRAFGGNNESPSCWQFGGNYKALLISNLSDDKRVGSNCEQTVEGGLLFTLESLLSAEREPLPAPTPKMASDEQLDNVFPPLPNNSYQFQDVGDMFMIPADKIQEDLAKSSAIKDIWIKCENCKVSFYRPQVSANKKSDFDLIYVKILKNLQEIMPKVCHFRNISHVLLDRVMEIMDPSWMYCQHHRTICHKEILKLIIGYFLIDWCTMLNRHLVGKANHLREQPMFRQATEMFEKLHTRRKK